VLFSSAAQIAAGGSSELIPATRLPGFSQYQFNGGLGQETRNHRFSCPLVT